MRAFGVAALLAWVAVASAHAPGAGEGGVEITSNGARLAGCEYIEFPAANYSPSRTGNVCTVPASSAMTPLGSIIGDATSEVYQGTAPPGTCDVGMLFMETDQPVPSTSADVCWLYVCTATNTWECLGDVNAGGRTGGQTVTGGAAADEALTLKSTANADMGTITLGDTPSDDSEVALTWAPTYGDNTGLGSKLQTFLRFAPTVTNDQAIGASPYGLRCNGSVTNTASSIAAPRCVSADWTLASSSGGLPIGIIFEAKTVYSQAAAATTSNDLMEFTAQPTYGTTGAVASTITQAVGYKFLPTITTDNAGGTQTVTEAVGFQVVDDASSGAGTETLTRYIAFDVESLSPANSGTAITLRAAGTDDQMRHAGPVMIGSGGVSTSPGTTQLYVWQNTLGNEVARFQSTATNDDPEFVVTQSRVATTDGTQTAFGNNAAIASGYVAMVEARVVARCTAGASCTSNQAASYVRRITCKNDSGTTAVVGAVQTVGTDQESTAGWDVTMDCDDTSDTARVLVTGAGTTTITWHVTVWAQRVST